MKEEDDTASTIYAIERTGTENDIHSEFIVITRITITIHTRRIPRCKTKITTGTNKRKITRFKPALEHLKINHKTIFAPRRPLCRR